MSSFSYVPPPCIMPRLLITAQIPGCREVETIWSDNRVVVAPRTQPAFIDGTDYFQKARGARGDEGLIGGPLGGGDEFQTPFSSDRRYVICAEKDSPHFLPVSPFQSGDCQEMSIATYEQEFYQCESNDLPFYSLDPNNISSAQPVDLCLEYPEPAPSSNVRGLNPEAPDFFPCPPASCTAPRIGFGLNPSAPCFVPSKSPCDELIGHVGTTSFSGSEPADTLSVINGSSRHDTVKCSTPISRADEAPRLSSDDSFDLIDLHTETSIDLPQHLLESSSSCCSFPHSLPPNEASFSNVHAEPPQLTRNERNKIEWDLYLQQIAADKSSAQSLVPQKSTQSTAVDEWSIWEEPGYLENAFKPDRDLVHSLIVCATRKPTKAKMEWEPAVESPSKSSQGSRVSGKSSNAQSVLDSGLEDPIARAVRQETEFFSSSR